MSTLAEKIGKSYIVEEDKQKDKQISISKIKTQLWGKQSPKTPFADITSEQWFWDMAVMP